MKTVRGQPHADSSPVPSAMQAGSFAYQGKGACLLLYFSACGILNSISRSYNGGSRMQIEQNRITLAPMTAERYCSFFLNYENDPDMYLPGQQYIHYEYSEERVKKYVQRQKNLRRIPLAVLCGDEVVGEIIIKNIKPHHCATMGIVLKNDQYKNRGIGTQAERLVVQYVFDDLDIPTLYADTIQTNSRSQHVLEKVGFTFIREDRDFKYYRIDRS